MRPRHAAVTLAHHRQSMAHPLVAVALSLALVGCATFRQTRTVSEMTGCERTQVSQSAHQEEEDTYAKEPAPELSWYQGCGKSLVCGPQLSPECWVLSAAQDIRPAQVATSPVVTFSCPTGICLRPQR